MDKLTDGEVFKWLAIESAQYPDIDFSKIRENSLHVKDIKGMTRLIPKHQSKLKPILSTKVWQSSIDSVDTQL